MVPALLHLSKSPRLLLTAASVASQHVPNLSSRITNAALGLSGALAKRDNTTDGGGNNDSNEKRDPAHIVFACLIPLLVLLSGVFAGLTLGYMSLDETQLNVLSISGTPQQKVYANKIKPIRKNGHLLLVTLLLANMIVNETLPVVADPVLGGGVQSVVVSTVLIVIFSEIIPQSLCTRYGLYFGAKMAGPVRVLIWTLGFIAWPVAKILEFTLGPHHGIIYRRAELKELIAMHSSVGELGGDLKTDTVTIIGGALDLQEKVVKQAMTPIEDVFMLSIDAKLDYETLRKVCLTGHSRVPVYEEIEMSADALMAQGVLGLGSDSKDNVAVTEVPVGSDKRSAQLRKPGPPPTRKVKKIIGILLVKQCVLLDPKDATPVRKIPLNKVPFVPNNEPLLGILDRFQTGRSHMAIVSRFSVEQAVSVKKAVKRGLTQRLLDKVGIGESDSSSDTSSDSESDDERQSAGRRKGAIKRKSFSRKNTMDSDNADTLREDGDTDAEGHASSGSSGGKKRTRFRVGRRKKRAADIEMAVRDGDQDSDGRKDSSESGEPQTKPRMGSFSLPKASFGRWEQSMPADAVLAKQGADEFLQSIDPAIMPLGIITLEDVLEELIGEEIYDEFDPQGHPDLTSYAQNDAKTIPTIKRKASAPELSGNTGSSSSGITSILSKGTRDTSKSLTATPLIKPIALPALRGLNFSRLGFARSRSAPPVPLDDDPSAIAGGEKAEIGTISDDYGDEPKDAYLDNEVAAPDNDAPTLEYTMTAIPTVSLPPPVLLSPPSTHDTAPSFVSAPVSRSHSLAQVRSGNGNGSSKSSQAAPLRAPVPVRVAFGTGLAPLVPAVIPSLLAPSIMASRGEGGSGTSPGPSASASASASPAPSLEQAIMIERMRRATAGNTTTPVPKGARFKSSPLTGDRNGVVVAESVRGDDGVKPPAGVEQTVVYDDGTDKI